MSQRLLFSLLLVSTLFYGISNASAHTVLIHSDPAANSTVTALPEQISLTFADPLLVLGSHAINQVQVVDPSGAVITSANNVVKGAVLTNVLSPNALLSGVFHVSFRVVALDGHVISGTFNFSVGTTSATPTLPGPIPNGIFQITAIANGSGLMGEVGSPTQSARVSFDLDFTHKEICYQITTKIPDVLAVHVHSMNQTNMSISDEIFLPINLASLNSKEPFCTTVSLNTLSLLYYNSSRYMIMFHTKAFPNGAVAGPLTSPKSFATGIGVSLRGATLTSTALGGSSALVLSLTNNQSKSILLTGISSSLASSAMIFYDSNMCQGNNVMRPLQNIAVSSGQTQLLGYKYQGGILSGLRKKLSLGDQIALDVHWEDFAGNPRTSEILASVVKQPKGLRLGTDAMAGMPGMTH